MYYIRFWRTVFLFCICTWRVVYVTVGCPSVCLSVPSIDSSSGVRLVCCWAQAPAADIDRQLARGAGAQQQTRAASCCEPRDEAQHGLVNYSVLSACWSRTTTTILELIGPRRRAAAATSRDEGSGVLWGKRLRVSVSVRLSVCEHISRTIQRRGAKYCDMHVCVSLCLFVCLSASISPELYREGQRSTVMCTSVCLCVCLSVCLSVCPRAYLRNYTE